MMWRFIVNIMDVDPISAYFWLYIVLVDRCHVLRLK